MWKLRRTDAKSCHARRRGTKWSRSDLKSVPSSVSCNISYGIRDFVGRLFTYERSYIRHLDIKSAERVAEKAVGPCNLQAREFRTVSNDNRYWLEQLLELSLSLRRWFDGGSWPAAKTNFTLVLVPDHPAIDPTYPPVQTSSHSSSSRTGRLLQAGATAICCENLFTTFHIRPRVREESCNNRRRVTIANAGGNV